MIELPDLPEGSRIKAERSGDRIEISWRAYAYRPGCLGRLLDPVAGCMAWAFAGFWLLVMLPTLAIFLPEAPFHKSPDEIIPLLVGFVISLLFLLAGISIIVNRRRARMTTMLDLTGQELIYTPPDTRHSVLMSKEVPVSVARRKGIIQNVRDLFRERPRYFVAREAVTDVVFEGREHFGAVSVKGASPDLDIGRYLSGDDRRWLAEVLRRWREAGSH